MSTRRILLHSCSVKPDTNASLWLDKFITGHEENIEPKPKQCLINDVVKIEIPEIYESFYKRWTDSLTAIDAKFRTFKVKGRMVVGLGEEGVLETSIALHRTYGVPFIPGSALKGLAASYAKRNLQSTDWNKGNRAYEFVFGSQDSAGFITFHDAPLIPDTEQHLHADIMTVHHSDYYGDKNLPPADWDNPVPIPFLSATGRYRIALSTVPDAESWIEFVFLILEKALEEEGVGAKTASGYGRGVFEKSDEENFDEQSAIRIEGFVKRVRALKNVAGEINTLYQEWRDLNCSANLKKIVAQAIIDKVREAGREKQSKEKSWYNDLKNSASDNT